jgi:uncharacterized cupredoxin-like copper-binding protein
MRRTSVLVATTATVAALALAVGCGSSSSSSAGAGTTEATTTPALSPTSTVGDVENEPTTTLATTAPTGAARVAIVMGRPAEFSMVAKPAQVPAGKVTFDVANRGTILHEMVVVPGDGAAALKRPDGTASEKGSPGEVPDVQPGKGGAVTITLPAGRYVVLCNLPGHFAGGMYTTLVVK